jgi:hypothetical protein
MKNADVGRVYMLYARRTSIQRDRQRVEVGQAGRDIPSSPLRRLAPWPDERPGPACTAIIRSFMRILNDKNS